MDQLNSRWCRAMRRRVIIDFAFLVRCLLRVFRVCRSCLVCKNHGLPGKHGMNRNRKQPFFKVNQHSTAARKRYHIGCQSWQYEDWVTEIGGETVFYPRGTKAGDMLGLYSEVFDTIEVDSTAYGTPAVSTLEGWTS